jgi:hypothetical protein
LGPRSARQAYYLSEDAGGDPEHGRQAQVVRRQVRGHYRYELHLVTDIPPYRAPGRYDDIPDGQGCVDLGVGPTAQRPPLTGALLVKHSAAEKMALVTRAAKLRRTQRAQERCAACSRKRALAQTKAPDRPPALSRSTGNVGGTLSGEP